MPSLLDQTLIAFDTETTGAYPVKWEICEIAAVKYKNGQIVDEFSSTIRPEGDINPISEQIHGYSKKSLDSARFAKPVLEEFLKFSKGGILVAHHAPFDLGFLSYDLERNGLDLPCNKVICTSLLSRSVFKDAPNHKLPTLIDYLHLKKTKLHVALNDARICMDLALKCFEHIKPLSLERVEQVMGIEFNWKNFSVFELSKDSKFKLLVDSIVSMSKIDFVYNSGSRPGVSRTVMPVGLVRTPFGDFMAGENKADSNLPKRFYLRYISSIKKTK